MNSNKDTDSETVAKIEELKKRFINQMKPDLYENNHTFYRFLKERDFNIDQAEDMLRKHLEWRKELKVDTIKKENFITDGLEYYFGLTIIGLDKKHAPITYYALGNYDSTGMRRSVKQINRFKQHVKIVENEMEVLEEQTKKLGKNLDGCIYIIDFKNFSFATATDINFISEFLQLIKTYQDNYPEHLRTAIFINASAAFFIVYKMMKTFVAASLLNKVQIYGQPEQWKPVLLNLIDADVLPAFLGGKRTDDKGDPECKLFVNHGGLVPTKFYIDKNENPLTKSPDAKKLVIPRASFSEIELEVKEPHSVIEWEFEIKYKDIGFGLFFKELDPDGEETLIELVPLLRLDTNDFSESGMFKCEKAGTYIILFDNSYSMLRSKEIYYKATILCAKEHEEKMAKGIRT